MRGGNTYNFKVVAKDNGVPQLSSESRVVISVLDTRNDRPEINVKPLFSHAGAAVVRESAAIGKVAALLTVTDHDFGRNGIVSCDLDNVHFSLQKLDENEYKIIVAQPLDRERAANHTVVIYCRDGGDPALSTETILRVEVSDSNDNNPVFSSSTYYLSVDENETIGSKVGRVTATDKDFGENARLIYGMEDNGDTFTIDTMLGGHLHDTVPGQRGQVSVRIRRVRLRQQLRPSHGRGHGGRERGGQERPPSSVHQPDLLFSSAGARAYREGHRSGQGHRRGLRPQRQS
ncbi:hypothetical protein BaRGS_00039479 [Batillaria attramentaria]|uniref:Cadherin domain-containing protein n=1 Tax=Batillaria attramentaria TaxID=370345 RepID=A0ABD0J3C5_9CAEN